MRSCAVSRAWTIADVSRSSLKMRPPVAPGWWPLRVSARSTRRRRRWPSLFRTTGNGRESAPRSSPCCSMRRRSVVSTALSPPSRRTTRSSDGCSIVLAGWSPATRASVYLSWCSRAAGVGKAPCPDRLSAANCQSRRKDARGTRRWVFQAGQIMREVTMRAQTLAGIVSVGTLLLGSGEVVMSQTSQPANVRNVVLVHGGWVDGSGWEGVYKALKKSGYAVTIVQEATTSLADDVATTKRAIALQNGPVILVGHSYGGAVITEAGNDPKVVGLVYVAAFAPDRGESVSTLIKDPVPGAPVPPILPPVDGYLLLDKAKFPASFAVDVKGSHAIFVSQPQAVASLIEKAAKGVRATATR